MEESLLTHYTPSCCCAVFHFYIHFSCWNPDIISIYICHNMVQTFYGSVIIYCVIHWHTVTIHTHCVMILWEIDGLPFLSDNKLNNSFVNNPLKSVWDVACIRFKRCLDCHSKKNLLNVWIHNCQSTHLLVLWSPLNVKIFNKTWWL